MRTKHYIFRWKEGNICVTPSRRKTEQEVWDFAAEWLIPLPRPKNPMQYVRELGEVIPDGE